MRHCAKVVYARVARVVAVIVARFFCTRTAKVVYVYLSCRIDEIEHRLIFDRERR